MGEEKCVVCHKKITDWCIIIKIGIDFYIEHYCSYVCFTKPEKNQKYKEYDLIMDYGYPYD